jgi:hypothetical protein
MNEALDAIRHRQISAKAQAVRDGRAGASRELPW